MSLQKVKARSEHERRCVVLPCLAVHLAHLQQRVDMLRNSTKKELNLVWLHGVDCQLILVGCKGIVDVPLIGGQYNILLNVMLQLQLKISLLSLGSCSGGFA